MDTVIIKAGRDASLRRHHPWVFSGAVGRIMGRPAPGATVALHAADGRPLGVGAYSPRSQIRIRLWDDDPETTIDADFFRERIARAVDRRRNLPSLSDTDAVRLVNAESDGLPGLVVDRYGEFLVCQFLAAGVEAWKAEIVAALTDRQPMAGIYERSESDVRAKEGLAPTGGLLWGAEPPTRLPIREGPLHFEVDIRQGHKTGFYLDQRDNRRRVSALAGDAEVLNAFSYTGGFGLWALHGGARHVTHVDTSQEALDLAAAHTRINGFDETCSAFTPADVFSELRRYRDAGRQFDLVVLDPPKFAASAGQVNKAARGYKDINLLALKLLRPGGLLATFSCSGHLEPTLFQKIVADAAIDAGRRARLLADLGQAADHPVALCFPEGRYLKGLLVQVD